MTLAKTKIAVLTGGGDCPGLNAVIRAVSKSAASRGWELVGFQDGYLGVVEDLPTIPLPPEAVRGILDRGGTILGTSNKANPFRYPVRQPDGSWAEADVSDQVLARIRKLGIDWLIAIGGDGTLQISHGLAQKGLKVVGCPKTIDNDLSDTDLTFGFDTARATATDAVNKLHTTAESHDRVMLLEVMGRTAGHLALHAGIAGGAEVVLLPEIPYEIDPIVRAIRNRSAQGQSFSIIVVAEGAYPKGGEISIVDDAEAVPGRGVVRLGGAGKVLADELAKRITEHEIRVTVLGHLARGGTPTAFDRVLGSRFGCRAIELIAEGKSDHMVALHGDQVVAVPLQHASKTRLVDLGGELVRNARQLGICLGDDVPQPGALSGEA